MKETIEYIKEHQWICNVYDRILDTKPSGGWAQFRSEITILAQFIYNYFSQKELRFMEIGMLAGKNFVFLGEILSKIGKTTGIGLDFGNHRFLVTNNISLEQSITSLCPKWQYYLIIGNSHEPKNLDKTKEILDKQSLDLLFIDGDHSAAGSMKDFTMYSPLVRKNGIIIFDDIMGNAGEVPTTWNKLKKEYKYKEFSMLKDRCGFGVLYK